MRKIVIFSREGRIGRRAYSIGVAAYLILMITMQMIVPRSGIEGWYAFAGLFVLASAMLVGLSARRLHDFGRPGSATAWTVLPICESAAIVSLGSGVQTVGLEMREPYVLFAVTAVFALWGILGTAWLMKTKGDDGENAYGHPAGSELPRVLVAGSGTLGLVGGKTIGYGEPDQTPKRALRWGRPEDRKNRD